jgi:hypothetical protein
MLRNAVTAVLQVPARAFVCHSAQMNRNCIVVLLILALLLIFVHVHNPAEHLL